VEISLVTLESLSAVRENSKSAERSRPKILIQNSFPQDVTRISLACIVEM
jgi:hypothetical protein